MEDNSVDERDIKETFLDHSDLIGTDGPMVQPGTKVIGGTDDRQDIFELTGSVRDRLRKELCASTVILTDVSRLSDNGNGTWTLQTKPFRQRNMPPCADEKFAHQLTGGWCSGFMVGPEIIVTAGHCSRTLEVVKNTAYIFGFQASSPTDPGTMIFHKDQVYFGKERLAFDNSDEGDYAIIQVDREIKAPGAKPLKVRECGNPTIGTNLGAIGYPSGLPVKISFGEDTRLMRDSGPWLIANLDTYAGNSGSAVFNNDGEVEGILVRGATDYRFSSTCFRSNRIENSEGSEAVTKASVFLDKIPS